MVAGLPAESSAPSSDTEDARHAYWMDVALELARAAERDGEVPVGAIVVVDEAVVGRGYNTCIRDDDPTAHAEIVALREAAARLGNYRLPGARLYATLEPCAMCAGLIVNARVGRLVYGADDPKAGAVRSLYQLTQDDRLNHRVEPIAGVLAEECGELLRTFFRAKR